ncbi:hypothetical protein OUZ56_015205 [Daphnia magna]|uniref:Transmembrane protein n=1 Tax=Daphnia magna TaxID=35525 RepID=A0ABR0AMH6_9CRUS|nr:hypothetical protein OUZ56_015205 [Daphnia magna]
MLVVNQKRIGNAGVVAFVSTSINLAAFYLARQLNVNFCISFATPSRISSPFLSIGKIQDKKKNKTKTAKDKITQQKKKNRETSEGEKNYSTIHARRRKAPCTLKNKHAGTKKKKEQLFPAVPLFFCVLFC